MAISAIHSPALEAVYRCNKCGFCQATCAPYQATREEWAAARGLIRLVRAIGEGELSTSDRYAQRLFECMLCGGCTVACPSGVEIEPSLLEARRALSDTRAVPEALSSLAHTITSTGSLLGQDGLARLEWAHEAGLNVPSDSQHGTVYFVGCVAAGEAARHSIPQGMVRLLSRAASDFGLLGTSEVCCGYPLWANGLTEAARALAQQNVERVLAVGATRVLTTCPSCYRAWRDLYPLLLGEPLAIEVVHATQWLLETGVEPLAEPAGKMRVTYHDPCNLGRKGGVHEAPRQLLARCAGLEFVEMTNARAEGLCCGGGGYLVEHLDPALSQAVARLRLEQALATGAEMLVTACPQCERTLASARAHESEIKIVDIIELYGSLGDR